MGSFVTTIYLPEKGDGGGSDGGEEKPKLPRKLSVVVVVVARWVPSLTSEEHGCECVS